MKRHEVPVLAAILLDMIGFGMVLPDIQLRAEKLGAPGWMIGLLLSSYFVVQFLVSPRWGAVSDRVGRKPVLVACTALSALSMVFYALAGSLWGILLSRVLAGLAAANVVVTQAYLADTSPEAEQTAALGRSGAALSVGLILGPALGGWLAAWGGNALLGGVAASLSALGALWMALALPRHPLPTPRQAALLPLIDLRLLRDLPALRPLFLLAAAGWFALACLEGTFGRLIQRKLGYGPAEFGAILGFEALVTALVQGVLLGYVAQRAGQTALLRLGYFLQGVGLLLTPFAPGLIWLFAFSGVYSVGIGLVNPTLNGICGALAPPTRHGELFGVLQAGRSIGFLVGPMLGGALFDWKPEAPYLLAGGVALCAAVVLVGSRSPTAGHR